MRTDVLFIHPGHQKSIYQGLSDEFTAIATPSWTCLLAEGIRQQGRTTAIYDANVEGWDNTMPAALVERYRPELVVMMVYGHHPSASTQTMPAARVIAADLKRYNRELPVAMGGIHPTALPERTLHEEPVDYVIAGEGLHTILGLADLVKGRLDTSKVPGLWYRKNGAPLATEPAPLLHDLDHELPGYAWDLLPSLNRYRAHNMHCFQDFERSQQDDFLDVRSPYVAMNTSLGCPHSCHYCCINALFGKPGIRYWSVERVVDWLEALARDHGVRHIRLDDELFVLSPTRVERFCDLLIERNLNLNLAVYGRVDTVQDRLLAKMKQAGINWLSLGIESGNEAVRNDVNKRIHKDIHSVVRAIQAQDIYILGNFMFGLPEDSLETMEETLQLAIDLNCEFVNFYSVMAYPGSRLYLDAVAAGTAPQEWSAFSQHSINTTPLPTRHLKSAEVLAFRDKAFDRYFRNPHYLKMIEKKFGPRVLRHIDKMLEVSIQRQLVRTPNGEAG